MDAAAAFRGALDDGMVPGWMGQSVGGYWGSAYAEGQEWLGYAVLALLSQRPEYRVMTDTYATEMTREWIEFKSKSERETLKKWRERRKKSAENNEHPEREMYRNEARIDELNTRLTEIRLKPVVKDSIEHDGFQGRGQIYIDTGDEDDPEELRTPIGSGGRDSQAKFGRDGLAHDRAPDDQNRPKRRKIERLAAIEPMWCYPAMYNASDPLRADWYRPETWWVMGKEVHRTRLLMIISNPVPDMLKPAYSFGGLSRTQMAKPYVDFWLRNRTSASDLLNNFSLWVLATELDVSTMDEGSELFARVMTANVLRDNQGMMLINKGTEEVDIKSSPLAGVKDLVGQSAEHMTVPNQIPIVKFFGNQPSGLNADSEGVIRLWYDRVHALQESLLREPIQTIVNLVMIELWGEVDDDVEFEFVELWQLDEAGKSAIQKTKADQRAVDIEAGVVSPEEGRMAAARDPDSQYAGLDLHEPLPEPDPAELTSPEQEGEEPAGPAGTQGGAKPQRRDLGSQTTKAANFGGAITGGLGGKDELVRSLREAASSLVLAMDALASAAEGREDERPFDSAESTWDSWIESQHPRGQPENKGQFASSGTAAAGAGIPPPPQIKSQHAANVGKQKHLIAMHALAEAGEWDKLTDYPTPGTNTYSKMVQKYKAYLLENYAREWQQQQRSKEEHRKELAQKLDFAREAVGEIVGTESWTVGMPEDVTRRVVDVVAPAMGFKSIDVGVRPNMGKKFTLNDQEYDYAGVAYLGRGTVEVFTDHLSPKTVGGILSHEIMHQKWETVLDRYKTDYARVMADSRGNPDKILRPDGTVRDEHRGEYPFYEAVDEHLTSHGEGSLRSDDGITDYSREWWKAAEADLVKFGQAVHETLAEMSYLDWEGSLDRLLWYKESKHWGPLYRAVNDLYGKIKQ
jgi:hypothetical protein